MTNMSIQPLWLNHFIEILLVIDFQLTRTYFGTFYYKAHFIPQISSNELFYRFFANIMFLWLGELALLEFDELAILY